MRIIGGKFKGHRFTPPAKKWPTRPTTDIAKEGLFNILNNRIHFEDTKVLDLFCGTGSHGYEFISRGCNNVTSVDKFPGCIKFANQMIEKLDIAHQMQVIKSDVKKFVQHSNEKYDYIFAGPPYPLPWLDTIPDLIFKHEVLEKDGLFVMEHNPEHDFKDHPHYLEERNYGETIFAFFGYKDE